MQPWHSNSAVKDAATAALPTPQPASGDPLCGPMTVNFDSDLSVYLDEWMDEGLKCKTLKKLFHSLEFNVMDQLQGMKLR